MSIPPILDEEESHAFESRKRDHIQLSLDPANQAHGAGFDRIQLRHEALPELNFSDVSLASESLGLKVATPFLISSMTAGHSASADFNVVLAQACERRGWRLGVGSQRRELSDPSVSREWEKLREKAPTVQVMGNIGLAQLIHTPAVKIEEMVSRLGAMAMIVHLNPLQECLQPEGTPHFRGAVASLHRLSEDLSVPVIVKETGCGISKGTLSKLAETKVSAVDLSGYGGTHWGRIEGQRASADSLRGRAAVAFSNWGMQTVDCLYEANERAWPFEIWASGGVRSGVDAAKALALGAKMIGVAQPALAAALKGEAELDQMMKCFEFELRTAMFCTGVQSPDEFHHRKVWTWRTN